MKTLEYLGRVRVPRRTRAGPGEVVSGGHADAGGAVDDGQVVSQHHDGCVVAIHGDSLARGEDGDDVARAFDDHLVVGAEDVNVVLGDRPGRGQPVLQSLPDTAGGSGTWPRPWDEPRRTGSETYESSLFQTEVTAGRPAFEVFPQLTFGGQ